MNFVLVGVGGFIGAIFRFYLSRFVNNHAKQSFSMGLLVVNVIGCLLMGMLMAYLEHDFNHRHTKLLFFLSFGLLASFTTFSSFGYETVRFLQAGQYGLGVLNVAAHLGLGLIAVVLGIFIIQSTVNFS